jgi:hypothetical protein
MLEISKPAASDGGLPNITIIQFRAKEGSCLRGYLVISLTPGLIIHGCKMFAKNGERWVKLPEREFLKKDGTKAYAPIVELASRGMEAAFQRAVLAALDAYLQENGHGG